MPYTAAVADKRASEVSLKTGDLIISYRCFDCGMWHIGHADESQIAARIPPSKPSCEICGNEIPVSRLEKAKRCGTKTRTCSKACAQTKRNRARKLRDESGEKPES